MANWKAEFLRYAGMMNDYKVSELKEIAEELDMDVKGYKKYELRWAIHRNLLMRMEAQEK